MTLKYTHRKMEAAGDILASTLKGLRLDKKVKQYENFSYWPEVVGPELSDITYPEKIVSNKLLVVRVIDSAWIQELSLRKHEFLEKLRKVCKNAYFEDIRFVSGDPKEFNKKKTAKS